MNPSVHLLKIVVWVAVYYPPTFSSYFSDSGINLIIEEEPGSMEYTGEGIDAREYLQYRKNPSPIQTDPKQIAL